MNPAVTYGVYTREGKQENKVFMYKIWVGQMIGAFSGVALSFHLLGHAGK